ncbi:copper-containing nitrite reductase [Azospirillum halopraeferens]|uniref:copper-containing nitrite reductase n=1 Tax=Azospirillum halopraeferens TaxID=34010 RepID=UPI0004027F74|nr:copper-containing nitrite reductase [Azospirillum halopraeferens]
MTIRRSLLASTAAALAVMVALAAPVRADDAVPVADIVRSAAEVPAAIGARAPQTVRVDLETIEATGTLADGTTYRYWTFTEAGGAPKVPGPLLRVRVGDTVEVTLKNHDDSALMHNVDFHAVTGLHGGGHATTAAPGETRGFTFKALNPGLYVYHCAVPLAAQHIANGMYGMILVEPEGGLPPVDREFYVMQGEIYTEEPFGTAGELTESYDKLMNEQPEYYVFNGAAQALTGDNALRARVGETVRIYFGVGGPNKTSSFHVIGEIFDTVYDLGSLTGKRLSDVQTILVPPGGAAAVEMKLEVPGEYILVDHALSRAARGLVGTLIVDGPEQPDLFREGLPGDAAARPAS